MGVHIVTDSSAVMPQVWLDELPVLIVPLQLGWENGELSSADVFYSEVAERLERGRRMPTTSTPSPGAYEEIFQQLLGQADTLVVVCPPHEFSTTYSTAMLAARQVGEDRIRVLDARTAAAGQGIVAAEAARAAVAGADVDRVLDRALDAASGVQIWATLSQLSYLRRSGRVPAVAAMGAGALGLHPIVRYSGGSPSPVGVTRSGGRAAERLFRAWEQSVAAGGRLRLVVFHSARDEQASEIHRGVIDRVPQADAHVVEVPASLAAHTGPGLLGLAWLWDP